jgi:peptide/nickel transport system substrate-binding protein
VKKIGIEIDLKVEAQDAYYGKAVFGQSDWLDSIMAITDYGHRGVPNVLISAPLKSDGAWNAAHFKNKEYDQLVDDYIAAFDLGAQRAAAGKMQRLLLDETPIIFSYFYDYLTPAKKNLMGIPPTPNRLFLSQAYFA